MTTKIRKWALCWLFGSIIELQIHRIRFAQDKDLSIFIALLYNFIQTIRALLVQQYFLIILWLEAFYDNVFLVLLKNNLYFVYDVQQIAWEWCRTGVCFSVFLHRTKEISIYMRSVTQAQEHNGKNVAPKSTWHQPFQFEAKAHGFLTVLLLSLHADVFFLSIAENSQKFMHVEWFTC